MREEKASSLLQSYSPVSHAREYWLKATINYRDVVKEFSNFACELSSANPKCPNNPQVQYPWREQWYLYPYLLSSILNEVHWDQVIRKFLSEPVLGRAECTASDRYTGTSFIGNGLREMLASTFEKRPYPSRRVA